MSSDFKCHWLKRAGRDVPAYLALADAAARGADSVTVALKFYTGHERQARGTDLATMQLYLVAGHEKLRTGRGGSAFHLDFDAASIAVGLEIERGAR